MGPLNDLILNFGPDLRMKYKEKQRQAFVSPLDLTEAVNKHGLINSTSPFYAPSPSPTKANSKTSQCARKKKIKLSLRGLWDIEQFELIIQTTRKTHICCLKNNQANGSIKKKRQGRASKKVPFKKLKTRRPSFRLTWTLGGRPLQNLGVDTQKI